MPRRASAWSPLRKRATLSAPYTRLNEAIQSSAATTGSLSAVTRRLAGS